MDHPVKISMIRIGLPLSIIPVNSNFLLDKPTNEKGFV
jgi:hypothetical protein